MASGIRSSVAFLFLVSGTGLLNAAKSQSLYEAMHAVFDVCVSNARSGTLMTEQKVLSAAGISTSSDHDTKLSGFEFHLEIGEAFSCVVWAEAGHYNSYDFRSAIDAKLQERKCVWRPVFPRNACTLPIDKVSHQDGSEYHFVVSYEIIAHEYAAMIIRPVMVVDSHGFMRLLFD